MAVEVIGCRGKDQFLKATSKLTSIEEATVEGYTSSSSGGSSSPGRHPHVDGATALLKRNSSHSR